MRGRVICRVAAALCALAVMAGAVKVSATGEYYVNKELPRITAEDVLYSGVSTEKMESAEKKLKALSLSGSDGMIYKTFCECLEEYRTILDAYARAMLSNDRDFTKKNTKSLDDASKAAVKSATLLTDAIKTLYYGGHKNILADIFGDAEAALALAIPDEGDVASLLEREIELENRYNELYGDSRACAELFCELVAVRNEIASALGYENYAEYADSEVYERNMTDGERSAFYNGVIAHFKPIYYESLSALGMVAGQSTPMSEDDVLLDVRAVLGDMDGELYSMFDYMIANNLYDIRYNTAKNPSGGAYTMYLPRAEVPFLYINPMTDYESDASETVHTLIHEFGHFAAMLGAPQIEYGGVFATESVDTCEVQSQGLELLAERHYGRLFGGGAPYERYYLLSNIVVAIVEGCFFDEWQRAAYGMENVSVDELNRVASELGKKYLGVELAPEDMESVWTMLPHNFQAPMYYLSYAVSGMAALSLYSESMSDYSGALDAYMRLSAEGPYLPFSETEFSCASDMQRIAQIAGDIKSAYAIGYFDIAPDAWYVPYVYSASNLVYGRAENSFMPDMPITRSEFVGAVGRMYDYYVGISGEHENTFSDVGDGDENLRYIAWANAEGIAQGYTDTEFGANDSLTREQAAAVIYRLGGSVAESESASELGDFSAVSGWAKEPVLWASGVGIIDGREDGLFYPRDFITRAETAKILSEYVASVY